MADKQLITTKTTSSVINFSQIKYYDFSLNIAFAQELCFAYL